MSDEQDPVVEGLPEPTEMTAGNPVSYVLKNPTPIEAGKPLRPAGSKMGEVIVDESITPGWLADAIRNGTVIDESHLPPQE